MLDSASTHHSLKINEALHITWERPNLNKFLAFVRFRCFRSSSPLIYFIDSVVLVHILLVNVSILN